MERTNEKKCPKCGNLDITDTGNRGPFDGRPNNPLPSKPAIYRCGKCGEKFIIE